MVAHQRMMIDVNACLFGHLLQSLRRQSALPVIFVVHQVEDRADASCLELLEVGGVGWMRAKPDRYLANLAEVEFLEEVAISLDNGAIDAPDTISAGLHRRILRAELAAVLVRLLHVDDALWISFAHSCAAASNTVVIGNFGLLRVEFNADVPRDHIRSVLAVHPAEGTTHPFHRPLDDSSRLTTEYEFVLWCKCWLIDAKVDPVAFPSVAAAYLANFFLFDEDPVIRAE